MYFETHVLAGNSLEEKKNDKKALAGKKFRTFSIESCIKRVRTKSFHANAPPLIKNHISAHQIVANLVLVLRKHDLNCTIKD